jgi:hypothetical protein
VIPLRHVVDIDRKTAPDSAQIFSAVMYRLSAQNGSQSDCERLVSIVVRLQTEIACRATASMTSGRVMRRHSYFEIFFAHQDKRFFPADFLSRALRSRQLPA